MLVNTNQDWIQVRKAQLMDVGKPTLSPQFLDFVVERLSTHLLGRLRESGDEAGARLLEDLLALMQFPQMQPGTSYKKKQKTDPRVGAWDAGNRTPYIGVTNVNNGERFPTSVLYFANGNNDSEHPTQKPVALYDWLVLTYSNVGETILDFCFGSGTTGVSAVRNSRDFIGIEKEPAYFSIAERRIKEAVLSPSFYTLPNNRLHMDAGDSPRLPSQSTLEGFTPAEQGSTPAPRQ